MNMLLTIISASWYHIPKGDDRNLIISPSWRWCRRCMLDPWKERRSGRKCLDLPVCLFLRFKILWGSWDCRYGSCWWILDCTFLRVASNLFFPKAYILLIDRYSSSRSWNDHQLDFAIESTLPQEFMQTSYIYSHIVWMYQ